VNVLCGWHSFKIKEAIRLWQRQREESPGREEGWNCILQGFKYQIKKLGHEETGW
jgi:hypothetical protein